MPNLLLFNLRPESERFIRENMENQACAIHVYNAPGASHPVTPDEYCLIFAEVDFSDKRKLDELFALRSRTNRCLTLFIFHETRQDLIKTSYIVGDGALVFPMEREKFNRIMRWYVSTGETRHLEVLRERKQARQGKLLTAINANKGLILTLAFLTLLLGAFVGIFCADRGEGGGKTGFAGLDKIIGVFYEPHK